MHDFDISDEQVIELEHFADSGLEVPPGGAITLTLDGPLDQRVELVLAILARSSCYQIAGLAERVYLSPARLGRLFKEHTGVGLGKLISEIRLQRAARMLQETGEPIKKVAAETGYSHTSSFVRAFRARFSVTPTEHRRRCQRRLRRSSWRLTLDSHPAHATETPGRGDS